MNLKERILELHKESVEDLKEIDDLLITIIVKFHVFEPCRYLSEDDEWVNFLLLPPVDDLPPQAMSLKKSEILSFGIINETDIEHFDFTPKIDSGLYQ